MTWLRLPHVQKLGKDIHAWLVARRRLIVFIYWSENETNLINDYLMYVL